MTKLKTHAIDGMAVRYMAAACLAVGMVLSCSNAKAADVDPGIYELHNHPDGALTSLPTVQYGLRLDDICHLGGANAGLCTTANGSDAERTFSVVGGTAVTLEWTTDLAPDLSKARITGQLSRNSDGSIWDIVYDIDGIVTESGGLPLGQGDGWTAAASGISGTLSMGTTTINLGGKNNNAGLAFVFDNDGHRCEDATGGKTGSNYGDPCDMNASDEIVANGWVMPEGITHGAPHHCCNDWLVVAKRLPDEVSEPATLALFGLGLFGLGYARRRRII